MPFVSALSRHPEAAVAVGEVVGRALDALDGPADLAVLFVSPAHLASVEQIAATVQTLLNPHVLIGSSAVGVLAGSEGVEVRPGLALWAAKWEHRRDAATRLVPLVLDSADPLASLRGLDADTITQPGAQLVVMADPTTFHLDEFLEAIAAEYPSLGVIGGLSSTAHTPAGNRLIIGGRVVRRGAVALVVPPALVSAPVVSQGCRPIGDPMTVTKSMGNVLYELAGRPALDRVLELVESLSEGERSLVQLGLHCGIVVDDRKLDFERGDFLVRGVLGASKEHRAVVIGDNAPIGTTVQFQVRDSATAGEDLEDLLRRFAGDAQSAIVFTCNGRGASMFGDSDHDARVVSERIPDGVAGMFCAGEIGPIGGRNAIHGFTASIALFRD